MGLVQVCKDSTDAIEFCESLGFFLKPIAKLNICVQLPLLKMPGKSISNWEVMEKLRKMIKPEEFSVLKVTKTTLEFLRFEAEVENKSSLKTVISRLDSSTIKLSGFPDPLKVRSAETKIVFPTRHDWDSYFRDAKHMDEMKPGERPDTICVQGLPSKWFVDKHRDVQDPSEHIVKAVFESFGSVRRVDIPKQNSGKDCGLIQTFSFSQDVSFDAYIQYREYMGFVKAMDALRGMKLMFRSPDGKQYVTDIKVDFDRTNHLSEKNIQRRKLEKQKQESENSSKERSKQDDYKKEKVLKSHSKEAHHTKQHQERKDGTRHADKRHHKAEEEAEHGKKIARLDALEKRCHLLGQRKQQSSALLDKLLSKIQAKKEAELLQKHLEEIERERLKQLELERRQKLQEEKKREMGELQKREKLMQQEKILREKLLKSLKMREEKRSEELREKLRKEIAGKNVLKSVLVPVRKHEVSKEGMPQRLTCGEQHRNSFSSR